MSKTILGGESRQTPEPLPSAAVARALMPPLFAFGLVLCGVAVFDLGFLWYPFRFGTGEWEFGVASRTFDSLAIVTTGFVFVTLAAGLKNATFPLRLVAVLAGLGCAALIAVFVLYWLNVPVALRAIPDQAKSNLQRGIVRSSSFAVLYIVLYAWLSRFNWRRARAARRGVSARKD